jgi:cell shape-determining protein MreD
MNRTERLVTYLILLTVQILFCNYLHLSQYVMVSILPAMILFSDVKLSRASVLCLAFALGFAVDFLSDGVLGLNVLALVPVAFVRDGVIRLVFGEEHFSRGEGISIVRQGIWKVSTAIVMVQTLFLLIYIWADGAGTRPLWFCVLRFCASLLAGGVLSLPVARILTAEKSSDKW